MCNFIHLSSSLTYLRSNLRYFLSTVRETFDIIQSSLLHFTFWQSISNSLCSDNCISNISFMRPLQLLCCCRKYLHVGNNLAMMDFPLRKRPSEMEEAPTWPEKVKNWIHHHFRQAVWDGIGVRNHPHNFKIKTLQDLRKRAFCT